MVRPISRVNVFGPVLCPSTASQTGIQAFAGDSVGLHVSNVGRRGVLKPPAPET